MVISFYLLHKNVFSVSVQNLNTVMVEDFVYIKNRKASKKNQKIRVDKNQTITNNQEVRNIIPKEILTSALVAQKHADLTVRSSCGYYT